MLVMRLGNAPLAFGLIVLFAIEVSAQAADAQSEHAPPPPSYTAPPASGDRPPPTSFATIPIPAATTPQDATPTEANASGAWYGWQLMLGDVLSMGAGIAVSKLGDAHGDRAFGDGVASAWALGMVNSAIVHGAHHQRLRAGAGIGARLVVAPVGALFGLVGGCLSDNGGHCSEGARYGFLVGTVAGALLDATILGHEREPDPERAWYGWQPLIIDVAMLGAGIATVRSKDLTRSETGAGLAVLPWVFGFTLAPWIHGFHGRWGTALASFAMRSVGVGFGALAGLIGYCSASGGDTGCTNTGATYGLLGGVILASAIDSALLSYAKPDTDTSSARVMPFVAPDRHGLTLGFSGAL